jgi:arylsulfatase A-like enzyme
MGFLGSAVTAGKNTKTPAIDQLAKEGFRYLYCFDNAAVCAPTRSCWITGMYGNLKWNAADAEPE